MKITDVGVTRLSWGMRPERLDSGGPETESGPGWERHAAFVEVSTDAGLTGISMTESSTATDSLLRGPLRSQLLGEDPFQVERIWHKMFSRWRKPVAAGGHDLFKCLSAIDNAIWDVIGKAANQPLYKLLGYFDGKISCYAAGGHYREGKTLDDLASEMTTYVAMGFRAVKMKVGRLRIAEDAERVKIVRQAIGEHVTLMVDANNSYTSVISALRLVKAIASCRPYWFEEPLYPDDRKGWLEVKQACNSEGIAVAGGENEFTAWGSRDFIQRRCVDVFQADASGIGGITEWKKVAALCAANHIAVSPHGDQWTHAHLVAHAPLGEHNEVWMFRQYLYDLIPPIPVENGYQDVAAYMTKPGLGLVLNVREWDSHIVGRQIPPYAPKRTEMD